MNIAFTYNVRHVKPDINNPQYIAEAEFDEPSTINGICKSLFCLGHKVIRIEADEKAYLKLKKLKDKNAVDLVFNIAEGKSGADREAHIPAMLEMLQIPYVGSKPLAQALCLNKSKTKEILRAYGIPTADFQLFYSIEEKLRKDLHFPLIVKPNSEGSSKGMLQESVVYNKTQLYDQINRINFELGQPALVETFLEGKEFTIGIIGNDPGEVLPLVEIDFSELPSGMLPLDSYEVKWIVDNPESDIGTVICPAKIDQKLQKNLETICLQAKAALNVLDFCRLDVRLDKKGHPYILEINQTPGLIPDPKENSRFPLAARKAGYDFSEMLAKIINSALQRYQCKP